MPFTDAFTFQLYSARKVPPIQAQLETLAEIGFANIEPYRDLYEDPKATRAMLDAAGLTAKTGHFGLDMLEAEPGRMLEAAAILGIEVVIAPSVPLELRDTDAAGWAALGDRLEALAAHVRAQGFRFGWHNHHWEFAALPDGRRPIEHLLRPGVEWEMDCAWVARAGADPLDWMERYGDRLMGIHFKDIAAPGEKVDEDGWADPGTGVLPLAAYWRKAESLGATVAVAEHDNPSDYVRFARQALSVMRDLAAADAEV